MRVADNKFVCRKPNYLLMNKQPNNVRDNYQELPNDMTIDSLRKLEKVGLVEKLEYDEKFDHMKPFKSKLEYFHPKRHLPPVNWTHDMNISPVEGYTFAYCQSMKYIQVITQLIILYQICRKT